MYWVSLCGTTSFTLNINDTKPTFFCLFRVCENDGVKLTDLYIYIFLK
jgi:hypothetical protein